MTYAEKLVLLFELRDGIQMSTGSELITTGIMLILVNFLKD